MNLSIVGYFGHVYMWKGNIEMCVSICIQQ